MAAKRQPVRKNPLLIEEDELIKEVEKEVEVEENEKEEEVVKADIPAKVTEDKLDKLINEKVKKLLKERLAGISLNTNSKDEKVFGSGSKQSIPLDDKILDSNGNPKPETFVTIGRGFLISVYEKDGSQILAPYRFPCEFKWKTFDKGRDGKADNVIHFSVFETWSKKEAEFIRESPFYGSSVFESFSKARSVDPVLISKIDASIVFVNSMSDSQLFHYASNYGWSRDSKDEIKKKISQMKLQEMIEQDKGYATAALQRLASPQKLAESR